LLAFLISSTWAPDKVGKKQEKNNNNNKKTINKKKKKKKKKTGGGLGKKKKKREKRKEKKQQGPYGDVVLEADAHQGVLGCDGVIRGVVSDEHLPDRAGLSRSRRRRAIHRVHPVSVNLPGVLNLGQLGMEITPICRRRREEEGGG